MENNFNEIVQRNKNNNMDEFASTIDAGEGEENMNKLDVATELAVLQIEAFPVIEAKDSKESMKPNYNQDVIDDYDYTRKMIILSIEESQRSLKEARKLFAITSNPKHGELIVKLLKTISDNSKMLFDLHADTISNATKKEPGEVNIDAKDGGTVLVATSAEILEALQSNRNAAS